MKPKIENKAEKIAFLMPGQGSFNDTLLMELVQEYSTLKPYVEVANSIIRKYLGKDLANVLQPDYTGKFEKIESDFELSQCVIFLLDYFYYHLLVQQGIKPDFIVGHSVGEIPALTAAGAFSFEEGLQIICHRTIAVRDYSKTGKMLAVFCDVDRIKSLLKFLSNSDLTLAVINGNQQLVVSGDDSSINQVESLVSAAGLASTLLKSQYPFHSDLLFRSSCSFYEKIKHLKAKALSIPVYSSIKRQFYNNSENVLESLALQLIKRVHFSEAIDILYQQGVRNFIEAGGGSALTKLVQAKFLGSPFVHAYEANTKLQNLKAKIISLPQPLIHNQNAIPKAIHTPKETGSEAEVISIIKNQLHETKNIQPQSVQEKILIVFKELTNYPDEVLELDADLESELGLDSVKQIEILSRVFRTFALPVPKDIKMSEITSIRKVIRELNSRLNVSESSTAIAATTQGERVGASKIAPEPTEFASDEVQKKILIVFKELTNYPDEVLELDADLESELGLDSVKQIEILSRVFRTFALPVPKDIKMAQFTSIRKVTELLLTKLKTHSELKSTRFSAA